MSAMHAEIINKTFIKLLTNLRTCPVLCVCRGKKMSLAHSGSKSNDAKWFHLEIYRQRFFLFLFYFPAAGLPTLTFLSCGVAFEMQKGLENTPSQTFQKQN